MSKPDTVVFSSLNVTEVYLVRSLLTREGIPSTIRGEFRAGLGGEVPMNDARAELMVPHRLETAALEAIENKARGGPDRDCPQCGEGCPHSFEVCWHCETPLPTHDDSETS